MASETSRLGVNAYSTERVGPIQGVTHGASSVLNDAMDLAELQASLFKADAGECMQGAKNSVLAALVAVCLMLASLPVLALGLSSLLHWGLDWPLWVCQLLVGILFVAIGIGLGYWCVQQLRHSLRSFESSQREAAANLSWLRQAISRSFSS